MSAALVQAMRRAGATALRDMRSEARKRIRDRKRIRASRIARVLRLQRPGRIVPGVTSEWRLNVLGGTTRVSDYPYRQTRRGVTVAINKSKRSLLRSAFVATMATGHRGVFVRTGTARLPIREPLASRPVDALLHPGEAQGVAERGARAFLATFGRLANPAAWSSLPALRHRIE